MFERPESSLTRIRRELPTASGVMCSYDSVAFATA